MFLCVGFRKLTQLKRKWLRVIIMTAADGIYVPSGVYELLANQVYVERSACLVYVLIATEHRHPPHTHTFVISIAVFLCPLCVCARVSLCSYIYVGAVSYTDDLCVHTEEVRATHQIADVPTRVAPPDFSNCI